jgi:hypothetical protein
MTLRDYFAAKAMQGMLANADSWINKDEVEDFATICYALAVIAYLEARLAK